MVGRGAALGATLGLAPACSVGVTNVGRQICVQTNYCQLLALFFHTPDSHPASRRDVSRRLCACRAPRGDPRAGPSPSRASRGARIATCEEKPRDRPSRARPRDCRRRRRGDRRPHRRVRSSRRGRAPGRSVLLPVRARTARVWAQTSSPPHGALAPSALSTCSAFRSHFSSPQLRKSWTPSSSTDLPPPCEERTPAEPLSGSN